MSENATKRYHFLIIVQYLNTTKDKNQYEGTKTRINIAHTWQPDHTDGLKIKVAGSSPSVMHQLYPFAHTKRV